jgi:type IV pilus assembly protein PilC
MMVMVVPKLTAAFKEMGIELPKITRLVMATSDFLSAHFVLGILGLVIFLVLCRLFLKTAVGKKTADLLILNLPVFSVLSRKINAARFSRNFSSLIDAGVPIFNALQIVASTMSNYFFRQSLLYTSEQIQKGEGLSKILANFGKLYPTMVIQMVEVGETTGSLSEILKNLADFYEEEVSNATKNLSSIIEPVLMVIIGIAVGFFAISMIQPMYSMIGQM